MPKTIAKSHQARRHVSFIFYIFSPGRTWRATNAGRWIHTPKGGAQPGRMNSHASDLAAKAATAEGLASQPPSLRGAPGCQPRDTATGTTPTWPPASSDGKPTARGLQFLRPRCITATGPPHVTPPEGPIGGGCGGPATPELAHSDAIR